MLNEWYSEFYNMLYKTKEYSIDVFWNSLFFGVGLSITSLFLATATDYLARTFSFRWRKALIFDYLPKWREVEKEVKCASQRIHEDTFQFARIMESLILQMARATMALIAFIPILWQLSKNAVISVGGWVIPVLGATEGNLVWLAVAATVVGMVISQCVSIKLPKLEYDNRNCEGAFRTGLEAMEGKIKNHITLENVLELFVGVEKNYRLLFLNHGCLGFWIGAYEQLMTLLPWLIFGPSIFAGTMLYGTLLQTTNAFQNVYGSLSMFNHNWGMLKVLQSTYKRLREFEKSLKKE